MRRTIYRTNASRMRGVSKAFTLIELMIVIVIIGIAAAMAVPMISSAASFQIRSAANVVAADLEYAKSMAISRGRSYSVVFDSATESYQIKDPNGSPVTPPGRKDTVRFGAGSQLNNVLITSVSFSSGTVTFDYLGSPNNGGTVELQAGGITKTVTVEPVTGFISVSN
jgi:prepilin-type N-terminal cleavage/methylation domain-containing protein